MELLVTLPHSFEPIHDGVADEVNDSPYTRTWVDCFGEIVEIHLACSMDECTIVPFVVKKILKDSQTCRRGFEFA